MLGDIRPQAHVGVPEPVLMHRRVQLRIQLRLRVYLQQKGRLELNCKGEHRSSCDLSGTKFFAIIILKLPTRSSTLALLTGTVLMFRDLSET